MATIGVGIDVGSRDFNVAFHGQDGVRVFENTAEGRRTLVRYVKKHSRGPVRVVLESTGIYGLDLAFALHAIRRFEVVYINPRAAKGYSAAGLVRAKTDRVDAELLAYMAFVGAGHRWQPPEVHLVELRALMRRIRSLVNERTREKNRLKAAQATTTTPQFLLEDLEGNIAHLTGRIDRLRVQAKEFAASHESTSEAVERVASIRGVGTTTALEIVGELGCLPQDLTAKQLVAQAGLDPRARQSGLRDGRRRISKMGSRHLRTALYFSALNGVHHCPEIARYHERLVGRGKKAQVAYIAVARKLLHCIHGMMRTKTSFDATKFDGRLAKAAA